MTELAHGPLERHAGGASALLAAELPPRVLGLAWLGQAGFLLRYEKLRIMVDPYLSDYLAVKYAGQEFPHQRLMPPPLAAEAVRGLDWVFCTHRHSDHMDPGSLGVLAENNPHCRFAVPRAEREAAVRAGVPEPRMELLNEGESLVCGGDVRVTALASAHESFKQNERGEHHFLGYLFRFGAQTVYHGGDGVAYEGLAAKLRAAGASLALLPVNGRSAYLASRGVPGNMDFDEACTLCLDAGIPRLIPHHFGMFAFNTADRVLLERRIAESRESPLDVVLPVPAVFYVVV